MDFSLYRQHASQGRNYHLYSHIRMEAKQKALEGIVSKPASAPQAPQPAEEEKPTKAAAQPIN